MEYVHALALALLLGMRHGLDPDHLAAIDGVTRFNVRVNPARARWCGLWLYRLARNTQRHSAQAMRRLAVAIAALSFSMAAWVPARDARASPVCCRCRGMTRHATACGPCTFT